MLPPLSVAESVAKNLIALRSSWCVRAQRREGTTSCFRKTTTDLRIGATEHSSGVGVQKSPFAKFLASFDFRLFRQHRPNSEVAWPLDRLTTRTRRVAPSLPSSP